MKSCVIFGQITTSSSKLSQMGLYFISYISCNYIIIIIWTYNKKQLIEMESSWGNKILEK